MKWSRCPNCKKRISWVQKWRFTKGFGSRRASPCPHCQAVLVWSKWPWQMVIIGASLGLTGILLECLIPAWGNVLNVILLLGTLLMLWGVSMARLEMTGQVKCNNQKNGQGDKHG